jgi:hypothetical protein
MTTTHGHDSDFASLRALSRISTLSVQTLRRRINDSTDPLPAYRVGRRGKLLVKLSEFRRWMNALKVQPTATVSKTTGGNRRANRKANGQRLWNMQK